MFANKDFAFIDTVYFEILSIDAYDISIRSRCTGHYWRIVNRGYPREKSCLVYHKHTYRTPYHLQGNAKNLKKAIRDIKDHDIFQQTCRTK